MRSALFIAAVALVSQSTAIGKPKSWEGTVAKIGSDGRVYITAGSTSGLAPGAALVIRRAGEAITDPKTHQAIGHELGRTVARLELESHLGDKLSVCTVTKGGKGLRIGDPVAVDHSADDSAAEAPPEADDPPPKPIAKTAAKPASDKPAAVKSPSLRPSETTAKNGKCPAGKFLNAATSGHCCWPEQLWSDQKHACIGAPRCPNGYARQGLECAVAAPSKPTGAQ